MDTENVKLSDGVLYIEGKELGQCLIEDFECDFAHTIEEYKDEIFKIETIDEANLTCTMIFDTEQFWKLTGLYEWVYQSCPNRRVRHFMKYGKTKRIRKKNFKRALRIVGRLLED